MFDLNQPFESDEDSDGEEAGEEVGSIDEDVTSQPVEPYVGMTFDNAEEAHKFYNEYAYKMGFGTRIAGSKYSRKKGCDEVLINRVFECVHARKTQAAAASSGSNTGSIATRQHSATEMSSGSKNSSHHPASAAMEMSDTRKRDRVVRHNCKAHMIISLKEGTFTVTTFTDAHTHPLVKELGRSRYYRSHRRIPKEDLEFLELLHNRNLRTSMIMGLLSDTHGGHPRNLGYVKRDVTNDRSKMRAKLLPQDMNLTIEYFEKRQAENPNFFFAEDVDDNRAVTTLFWVDGRTRLLYPKYRDCVFFDTTFCTNRYNMPFAPIVGINNHLQTVVLGCALLENESKGGFKWVFEQWRTAMDGLGPVHIMTDQDAAMAKAISDIFPDAIHRNCFWHVIQIAKKKIGKPLQQGEPFAIAFWACIFDTDTIEEFETSWLHMLQWFQM